MSEEESTTDWAQLVCLTDVDTPPFLIGKDKFSIGRAKSADTPPVPPVILQLKL